MLLWNGGIISVVIKQLIRLIEILGMHAALPTMCLAIWAYLLCIAYVAIPLTPLALHNSMTLDGPWFPLITSPVFILRDGWC